jgi:hypothetical protein
MQVLKTISVEFIGLVFLVVSAAITTTLPDIADFWLALATAITLFLLMYLRIHYSRSPSEREEVSR